MSASTFKELGISADLRKGLKELGIETPTPIQEEVIPILLNNGGDLVGQAQTGTGKTAAYGLPILEQINPGIDKIQALILCPTRELGQQIAKQLFKFTKYTSKIFTEAVYGGANIDEQISKLKRRTHIVVATPGRLIDLLNRKAINLSDVNTLVLDEADEMLNRGFKDDLDTILTHMSRVQNKWLFSATMPQGIRELANKYMDEDCVKIQTDKKNVVNKNIEHQYVRCEDVEKVPLLMEFLKSYKKQKGIIFCRTKSATQHLCTQLLEKKLKVGMLHGDMLQKDRDKVMRAFKNETIEMLVATDVAARGIDIPSLAFVVHYQLPDQDDFFTHRSGRTARAGKRGVSMALVNAKELKNIKFYEKTLGIVFKQLK